MEVGCKKFENKEYSDKRLIIVTGFGPFSGHEFANASWEAVQILPEKLESKRRQQYKVEKKLIQVTYDDVDKNIEEIWNKSPDLVIHCGVHGQAKTILIENSAYNKKFYRCDYSYKLLPDSTACLSFNGKNCERLLTKLNTKKISQNINKKSDHYLKIKENQIVVSNDVGNYLCGYIYLKSLDINCHRTLFVHVPPINKPFTSQETSSLILEIIQECVEEIEFESSNRNVDIVTSTIDQHKYNI